MTINEARNMVAKFQWQVVLCSKHKEYWVIDKMLAAAETTSYPLLEWNEKVYIANSNISYVGTCEELGLFNKIFGK